MWEKCLLNWKQVMNDTLTSYSFIDYLSMEYEDNAIAEASILGINTAGGTRKDHKGCTGNARTTPYQLKPGDIE